MKNRSPGRRDAMQVFLLRKLNTAQLFFLATMNNVEQSINKKNLHFESDSDFLIFVPKSSDLYTSGKIELFSAQNRGFVAQINRGIAHLRRNIGYRRNTNPTNGQKKKMRK